MKIAAIRNNVTRFMKNKNYEKEQQFLNKFCKINNNVEGDTFTQLYSARKTIANYAKNKGITIEIADAEKKFAEDKLAIKVKPLINIGNTTSITTYAPKNTKETHLHTVNDYFVIELPHDGIQQIRLTKHEYEDNFLRNVYRKIENVVKTLEKEKALINKKK